MSYVLKEDMANEIKEKYRNSYIAKKLGLSSTYVSLILHRKKAIKKHIAYSFTKVLNSELEIEDLFERV